MRRRGWLGVIPGMIALAFVACGGGPQLQQFGREDQAAIRKLVEDLVVAYNAKDSAKALTVFAGNATMMPPNSSATHGPEGVKGYYDMRFLQGATGLEVEITEISGQGTLAYITGTYSVRNEPTGGTQTRDRGKLLWIARHLPGNNWRFEVQMWSSDLPPQVPEPEPQKK